MRALILAVGSELLGIDRLDTNSLKLTAVMRRFGVDLVRKEVVGDQPDALAGELRRALEEVDLVLVTGGLGPTVDDLTRQAVAQATGRDLRLSPEVVRDIEEKFSRFRMPMPEVNRRQAEIVEGAEILDNPRGTAPGQRLSHGSGTLFLFPGVPAELEGMIEAHLEPWLSRRMGDREIETRVLRVACVSESALEEQIESVYSELGSQGISLLSSAGEISIQLTASGSARERQKRLQTLDERLREILGRAIFSGDAEDSLEAVVGRMLVAAEKTVATAESCTGGLVAERLTRVPGSSQYFLGSMVTYSDRTKSELLGVSAELLERHGAVSEEVVRAMASGVRRALGADFGIAVSGIAGPAGGSEEKPVGTVHLAVEGPDEADRDHRRFLFPGDRQRVRRLSSQWALDLLRRRLLERGAGREAAGAGRPDNRV